MYTVFIKDKSEELKKAGLTFSSWYSLFPSWSIHKDFSRTLWWMFSYGDGNNWNCRSRFQLNVVFKGNKLHLHIWQLENVLVSGEEALISLTPQQIVLLFL